MADINGAHAALTSFCKDQPGIGIGKELFAYLVNTAIALTNGPAQKIRYKSSTPFNGMEVSFSGKVDSSSTSVVLVPIPDPTGGPAVPTI